MVSAESVAKVVISLMGAWDPPPQPAAPLAPALKAPLPKAPLPKAPAPKTPPAKASR